MGTVTHIFDPEQEVYVIHTCNDKPYISMGVVLRVRIEVLALSTQILYDVRLGGDLGTTVFAEEDVFATKLDALVEYDARVA